MLCLRENEFVYRPLKSKILFSYSSPVLPELNTAYLQSQILWELIFPVQVPRAGMPSLNPSCPKEGLLTCDIPLVGGCHAKGMCPKQTTSLLLPLSMCLFPYISGYGRAALLHFMSFSKRVALYVVVVLLCLWKE